jgi:MoxR-like ATPase
MSAPPPQGNPSAELLAWAQRIKELRERTLTEVARVVVGMDKVVARFLIALLAGGHVLLEGVPGVAKTTLSKTLAQLLGIQFNRIQFTPDLLPSDVTGTFILDRKSNDFVLRKGPIFCQLLLADEINRAPAKTQSALLEAMQEYQVTIEGQTLPLRPPFMVLATQNPVEHEGVYRLPEAQLDRFLLRLEMGYPGPQHEIHMLKLHSQPFPVMQQLYTSDTILEMQAQVHHVYGADELLHYIINLAEASRHHPDIALGASPRASLNLLRCARARALLDGRAYFTHEDVQAIALPVLGHRLILRPEAEVEGRNIADVLRELLQQVPVML